MVHSTPVLWIVGTVSYDLMKHIPSLHEVEDLDGLHIPVRPANSLADWAFDLSPAQ